MGEHVRQPKWLEYVEVVDTQTMGRVLKVEKLLWRTKKHIYRRYVVKGKEFVVCVPPGFVTDLASIPAFLWVHYTPWGPWTLAAIIHDLLYGAELCTRYEADLIFYEAMRDPELGGETHWWTANVFYQAVRKFGWTVYGTHTRDGIEQDRRLLGACREWHAAARSIPPCELGRENPCTLPLDFFENSVNREAEGGDG